MTIAIAFFLYSLDLYTRLQANEMSTEIYRWAKSGNLEGVQQLLEAGANIEETGNLDRTALSLASLYGHFEIVVYLVEHGACVAHTDSKGTTALHCASMDGNLSTVKLLLKHSATVIARNVVGSTALLYAAVFGHLEVVRHLLSLEGGASITETDSWLPLAFLVSLEAPQIRFLPLPFPLSPTPFLLPKPLHLSFSSPASPSQCVSPERLTNA
jgi:ankyrin repeat protein